MFFIITIIGLIKYLQGNKYFGLITFLFLLTDGFQFVPKPVMLFGLNLYGKDYALMFSMVLLFAYIITGRLKFPFKNGIFISILIFLVYLFISAIIDLSYYNPSISGFALIFRINLFLLTYFWLIDIDLEVFERVFKLILIITIIQSALCILQIPTGLQLLTGGGVTDFDELGFKWLRYSNTPYFILPCLFTMLLSKNENIPYKNNILLIFILTILFTLTRTLILGLFITIIVAVFLGFFAERKKMLLKFAFVFILAVPLIGARVLSSTEDVNAAISTEQTDDKTLTFTYRILHVAERYQYISKTTKGKIFGIGFIHERDFPKNTFLLGHKNDDGDVIQLEQDDTSWSNMFLRYGIAGSVLYVFIFVALSIYFFKNRKISISAAMFMFMVMSIILSFSTGKIGFPDFYIIPIILFFYIRKLKDEQSQSNNSYTFI